LSDYEGKRPLRIREDQKLKHNQEKKKKRRTFGTRWLDSLARYCVGRGGTHRKRKKRIVLHSRKGRRKHQPKVKNSANLEVQFRSQKNATWPEWRGWLHREKKSIWGGGDARTGGDGAVVAVLRSGGGKGEIWTLFPKVNLVKTKGDSREDG